MVQSPSEPSTFIGEDVELVWQHYGLTSDERWWANRALLLDPACSRIAVGLVGHEAMVYPDLTARELEFLGARATLAVAASLPAAAQFQKPEDAVKYRKAVMTVMANHFGRVGAMVAGRAPYDAGAAAANAAIAAEMSNLPFIAFPDGTAGSNKGEASAKIWSERAKFDGAAKKMQEEMAKLAAAAKATTSTR